MAATAPLPEPPPTIRVVNAERVMLAPPPEDAPGAGITPPGITSPEPDSHGALSDLIAPPFVALGVKVAYPLLSGALGGLLTGGRFGTGEHWSLEDDEADAIAGPLAEELAGIAARIPFVEGSVETIGSNRVRLLAAIVRPAVPRVLVDLTITREAAPEPRREPRPAGGPSDAVTPLDADHGGDTLAKITSIRAKD